MPGTGQIGFLFRRHGDRGEIGVRRARHLLRRKNHDEIEPARRPINFAQIGDGRRERAPKNIDRYRIANADIQPGGNFGIKRNEWRTLIVWCPPCSFNNLTAFGRLTAIGQAAVAAQYPRDIGYRDTSAAAVPFTAII